MENNLPSKQSENFRNISKEIILAENGIILKNCSDEQIKQAYRYGITLLGLSSEKIPKEESEKMILIIQIKRAFPELFLSELRQSFEFAAQGLTIKKNDTYNTFSVRMISEIIKSYLNYKKAVKEKFPKEEGMNNLERMKAVVGLLDKDSLDTLRKIGSTEKKTTEQIKLPYHDIHQKWLKQFDKLRLHYEAEGTNGRFIKRYGKIMDVQMFFEKKAEQLKLANERNIDLL